MEWLDKENRRFPRAEARLLVRARVSLPGDATEEGVFEGTITDVSHAGVHVVLDEFVPEDYHDLFGAGSPVPISLKCTLPGDSEEAEFFGVIAYFRRGNKDNRRAYELGVRLDSMERPLQKRWNKFLSSVLPMS